MLISLRLKDGDSLGLNYVGQMNQLYNVNIFKVQRWGKPWFMLCSSYNNDI